MEQALHVGSKATPESVDSLADAIVKILNAARETNMDQSTTVSALELLSRAYSTENVTVANCTFQGDNHKHYSE